MAKVRPPGAQKLLNGFRINMEFITTSGYDHTCKSTWRWENVGGLGEQVTCHMFRLILSILFFFFTLFLRSRTARNDGLILTIYSSYDLLPRKEVPFVVAMRAPHLGDQILKNRNFGGANRRFKPKLQNITRAQQQLRWATVAPIDMSQKEGGLLCPFRGWVGPV